ncbi:MULTISPECIES: hypothetical protein [Pseudomonadaceae]|uniref:hypothetical protein n=1 Tax=Pseudomonadaceae TaxID=135621 RepID=UPI001040159E|nr:MULTISPECIES: hypothetical protein [Pseudomonadaceae]MBA1279334.1 hypothetical protein [Stutzerimonas stutzeri]TCD24401.1 hypothetical protein E0D86_04145 [Pseudomonas sp. IC_126]
MKGAEAYVNDQWHSSGLANLPEGPEAHCITLKFIIPRDAQFTGLINHVCEVAQRRLSEFYEGRKVTHKPVVGSVVGDGSGDGVDLVFDVAPAN